MTVSRLRVGVIGYGYWGPNLVRNFQELEDAEVVSVCDIRRERREHFEKQYPGLTISEDWQELVRSPAVDAVVVATPVSTHYQIAREALQQGKDVFVEKPLALGADKAGALIELSQRRQRTLMVGHTFLYHGAVRKIRELMDQGELGEPLYLDSTRANLGILQDDINVIWDLAPHDLSIMDFLLRRPPLSVSATGASHTGRGLEDVAFITLHFPDHVIAHVNVNWLSPVKIRRLLVGGTDKMVVFDDNEPSEKVKVYDRGVACSDSPDKRHNELIQYRAGDIFVPQLDLTEALLNEARDFVASIREGRQPLANAESGLRIVKLLELACLSLSRDGAPVEVN